MRHTVSQELLRQRKVLFENPFHIEDLMVFDGNAMRHMLCEGYCGLSIEELAHSLQGAPGELVRRIEDALSPQARAYFLQELCHPLPRCEVARARRAVLDKLFWELTYWKTPGLYEELTVGEQLHPGIFERLDADIQGKIMLDVGAGSGRATFECLEHGARLVYAVEPSPGLRHILKRKCAHHAQGECIVIRSGRFDAIPLGDSSVDMTLSCSAFTSASERGGEAGLAEMQRVTRPGGKIVLIWPRAEDLAWLSVHGFQYVALPIEHEMNVRFRTLRSALYCAHRFYGQNRAVAHYMLARHRPEVPFSVIGINPPCDYCWLTVSPTQE